MTETNRRAKYYKLTTPGRRQFEQAEESFDSSSRVSAPFCVTPDTPAHRGSTHGPLPPHRQSLPQSSIDRDIADELQSHIDFGIEPTSPQACHRKKPAATPFSVSATPPRRENGCRLADAAWPRAVWRDIRYAARQLRKVSRLHHHRDHHARPRHRRQHCNFQQHGRRGSSSVRSPRILISVVTLAEQQQQRQVSRCCPGKLRRLESTEPFVSRDLAVRTRPI